uniref:Calponin-homology (CH) domain-containing protein n=1 Tax=Macrostomum lignano TaxID=282301 RepID=A0A1I8GWP8_9PLAT
PEPPNKVFQLLSTKEIQDVKETAANQTAKDGLGAVPMSQKEKEECRMLLRPQELHQTSIHLVVEIDCRELRHSSPLSQVVPPKSKALVPLIFESALQGRFQRNVSYVINGNYRNHVIALAEVVPVQLELSTQELEVVPCEGQPAEAGIRGVITLYNRLNHPAEFSWEPVLKERQHTAFSIRPRAGVVEAFKDIDCEVVFRPSFNAPDEGYFRLHVEGGNDLNLKCVAKFGPTNVQFVNRRVMFGSVPLNMTTVKKAVLVNNSQNHAYFHVINSKPWPGMELEPLSGVVPVGGQKEIRISFTPSAVSKFDCGTRVAIRGWRDLELRMGGTILSPCVDIPLKEFNFDGVYVGASKSISFELVNQTQTDSRLEFDLKRYPDFSLDFGGRASPEDLANPGVHTVTLRPEETLKAVLTFRPKEVASYSFLMPVVINNTRAPSPAATPVPPSPAPTVKDGISMSRIDSATSSSSGRVGWTPHVPVVQTPRKLVKGIALRPVLRLSRREFAFQLAPEALQDQLDAQVSPTPPPLNQATPANNRLQLLTLENTGDSAITWAVDLPNSQKALRDSCFSLTPIEGTEAAPEEASSESGRRLFGRLEPAATVTLTVQFSPRSPGQFKARLPVVINDDWQFPYDHLTLRGELTWPSITFVPPALTLTPCPLHSAISVQFSILAANYAAPSRLEFTLPQVEADDGSPIKPLRLEYIDGRGPDIFPATKDPDANGGGSDASLAQLIELRCRLTFEASTPVSISKEILFQDSFGNQTRLPVSATADNCLLTLYPFVLKHREDYHIVTEQGKLLEGRRAAQQLPATETGEPQMVACRAEDLSGLVAASSRPSTTATSSNFEDSSTSYEETLTESAASNTPRDGAVNNPASSSKATGQSGPHVPGMVGKTGKTRWPDHALTESSSDGLVDENYHLEREGLFYRDMLSIVQRWFTNYGWPGGQFPVTVPNSMRSGLSRKQQSDEQDDSSNRKKKSTTSNDKDGNKDGNNAGGKGAALDSGGGKSEVKTIYDMITHLCGRPAPGIPISAALPSQAAERVKQIYWQHATLLTFLRSQGGCLASVRPEHLMEPKDYRCWKSLQAKKPNSAAEASGSPESIEDDGLEPSPGRLVRDVEEAGRDEELFECVSKRAWTDVLLQILKTLVLYKVTPRSFKNLRQPDPHMPLPSISLSPLASNVYTVNERILLAWLNHFYDNYRTKIWTDGDKGGVPPARWVINFDHDLLDGLVLAAVIGAHCPYLIDSHLRGMYTAPSTPEQCLHNSLRVVNAMRFVGLDFDVQALDLTAPNPVLLMLLCVYLYQTLPQYIIKSNVDFSGGLHQTCSRQVTLVNPVAKTLAYRAALAGRDAADFSLPKGDLVSLPPKGRVPVSVEFRSRFLRPAEAVLLLIGRPSGPHQGSTQVFRLVTQVNSIQPISTVQVASHCYELKPVRLNVVNPFNCEAVFAVSLVEGGTDQLLLNACEKRQQQQQQQQQQERQIERKKSKQGPPPPRSVDTKGAQSRPEPPVSMKSFFCHVPEIRLAPRGSAEIDMNFLPFQVDKKQCSVVLRNPTVGEFVYGVEAVADLPVPTRIPMEEANATPGAPPTKTVRISSAVAASRGQSSVVHDHSIVYWRTEANKEVKEVLKIPLINEYKEKALLQAAQQHLSLKEVQRRRVTGTLESGTLVEKAMEMLSAVGVDGKKLEKTNSSIERRKFQFSKETIDFQVELDSHHFRAPSVISIPHPRSTDNSLKKDPTVTTFDLPLEFRPKRPGVYPVTIILKANDDVRLFRVECIVIPEGFSAELQFESPVNQAVLQNIPVINQTKDDWRLKAEMHGVNFHGPDYLLAKAYKTTSYPLTFKPTHEGEATGRLLLTNLDDGTEHCYVLGGIGRKPLALDHLVFDCQVGESITRVVLVPNNSKRKLLYQVESNLSFVGGKKEVTVLPGRQVEYTIVIAPNKRGKFDGVIAFVADKDRLVDYDSDGEELPPVDDNPSTEHRVWYSMELSVAPGEPMGRLDVTCPCYRTCEVEFTVRNPLTDKEIELDAEIRGESLSGEKVLRLAPAEEVTYRLAFSPALVEDTIGSVIFFNSEAGEFWYELNLHATPPPLTVLEPMECELGQHVCQEMTLENPSSAPIVLRPQLSNANNFGLEITDSEVHIPAGGSVTLNLRFTPSDLGFADHACRITFHSDKLKEWIFEVNGSGLMPSAQNPVAITAPAGSNSTLIIPFHNPLDVPVMCDILLTDSGKSTNDGIKELENSPFCLLLKHCKKIRLEPKARLDIPVSFAPENMQQHEAVCVVIMRRRDGKGWHYCPDEPKALPRSDSGGIAEIRWRFRVVGVPENKADRPEVPAPLVSCPARTVAEDRLEVWLAGVAPTPGAPQTLIRARTRTPAGNQPALPAGVEEAADVPEPFTFGLVSLDDSLAGLLSQSVKLELLRQVRDSRTGMVVLTFALRLQPYKTFRVKTHLVIKSNAGGFWRYPLTVESTDPEPDDVITINAAGLDRASKVMFRLTSKELHPVKFRAYFEENHDSGDFHVEPQSGELPPHGTDGLPFTVTFLPSYYGKPKRVRLVIRTDDMEWTYIIVGEIPEYQPPQGRSLPPVSGPHPNPIVRSGRVKNYIRENMRMEHTGVSSPIKLAPLMCKKEQVPLF